MSELTDLIKQLHKYVEQHSIGKIPTFVRKLQSLDYSGAIVDDTTVEWFKYFVDLVEKPSMVKKLATLDIAVQLGIELSNRNVVDDAFWYKLLVSTDA